MLRDVESFNFLLIIDANAGNGVDDLEKYDRADQRKVPRDQHANKLVADLPQ